MIDDYSRIKNLHAALGKVTWMAEEWLEHTASGCTNSGVYEADIREARMMLSTIGRAHASDCSMHNEPASPNGPCDCGAAITAITSPAVVEDLSKQDKLDGE